MYRHSLYKKNDPFHRKHPPFPHLNYSQLLWNIYSYLWLWPRFHANDPEVGLCYQIIGRHLVKHMEGKYLPLKLHCTIHISRSREAYRTYMGHSSTWNNSGNLWNPEHFAAAHTVFAAWTGHTAISALSMNIYWYFWLLLWEKEHPMIKLLEDFKRLVYRSFMLNKGSVF